MTSLGLLAAFGALLGWGFGDYFIQKLSRRIGSFRTLFFGGTIGFTVLTPIVWPLFGEIRWIRWEYLLFLGVAAIVFFYAYFNYEALRKGKLAVIAPVLSLELPLTILLTAVVIGEWLNARQLAASLVIMIGFLFVAREKIDRHVFRHFTMEKGVGYAVFGVFGLAVYNFLIGVTSRTTNPLLISWTISAVVMILALAVLVVRREFNRSLIKPLAKMPLLIIAESVSVTGAGLSFAFATTQIPIAVATGVSEGYVALAALLGLLVNREKLARHQFLGIIIVFVGIMALAWGTG